MTEDCYVAGPSAEGNDATVKKSPPRLLALGGMSNGERTMAATFRLLQRADTAFEALASLLEEMQLHYKVPCPPRARLISALNERPTGAEIIIAERDNGNDVLAFCALSAIYPGPGLQSGIFLKELYVGRASRGQGLGRMMMREVARFGRQRNLTRIDWTADANDTRLLTFYDSLGGNRKPEKLFYRLDGDALSALCDG